MMDVFVSGLGLLAPGLPGWTQSLAVLRGVQRYKHEPLELSAPAILSPRERRRSSPTVRMALHVASEAVEQAGIPARELATVFGSSNGSGLEIHQILEAVATPEMLVSPTHFHNSVHNSAVGYWCIATDCHQPSTSIASHDYTFPAALLKAAAQVNSERRPVLVAVFDCPLPRPLDGKRPIAETFASAFVLTPDPLPTSLAGLTVIWGPNVPADGATRPHTAGLEALWCGNPAARSLPLLERLAKAESGELSLTYPEDGHLMLELKPC